MNNFKKMLSSALAVSMIATSFTIPAMAADEYIGEETLKYVYVESSDLDLTEPQNIVVSLDKDKTFSDVSLVTIDDDGTEEILGCNKNVDGTYLFNREYTEEEAGVYKVDRIILTDEMETKELSLTDLGIDAEFSVYDASMSIATTFAQEETEDAGIVVSDTPEEAEEKVAEALLMANEIEVVTINDDEEPISNGVDGDFIVCLDPGHDGISPGAQSHGYGEEKLVLSIAKYCKEELEKHGIKVIMTRNGMECPLGETSSYNHNEGKCLKRRVDIGAESDADILVSFHLNAAGPGASGAEVYYPNKNYKPGLGKDGKELAQNIQNELANLGLSDRGIKDWYSNDDCYPDGSVSDYLFICRESKKLGMSGVLIEHAFITSDYDINNFLSTESGLKSLGVADAKGIIKYKESCKPGWHNTSDGWIYRNNNGGKVRGKLELKEGNYYMGPGGIMATGWVLDKNKWYYADSSGLMQSNGWHTINGKDYYFHEDGHMAANEFIDGFYLDKNGYKSEVSPNKWIEDAFGWKYIDENKQFVKSSFKEIGGKEYYFNENEYMVTGWQKLNKDDVNTYWYYFDKSGAMIKDKWATIDNKDYYFYKDGHMASDETTPDGYYVDKSGVYKKDKWVKNSTGWWYSYARGGYPKSEFKEISGQTYYFDNNGYMLTGWNSINGKWYYFNTSGHMYTSGWKWIGNNCYYFYEDGHMASGEITPDGYKVNPSGAWSEDKWVKYDAGWWYSYGIGGYPKSEFKEINGQTYYFKSNGYISIGWEKIDGTWYYFNESGYMKTDWIKTSSGWYYLDKDGKMLTGWQEINDEWYFLDDSGKWIEDKVRQENLEEPEIHVEPTAA